MSDRKQSPALASHSMLRELVDVISTNVAILDDYIKREDLENPNFNEEQSAGLALPTDLQICQTRILEATEDLQALVAGPAGYIQRQTLEVIVPTAGGSSSVY